MDAKGLVARGPCIRELPASGAMRVPVRVCATRDLLHAMDERALAQAVNVAALPGIVGASCMMPDAHWGYGFPIGGVAAFDADAGGVVSAGGVGFDVSHNTCKLQRHRVDGRSRALYVHRKGATRAFGPGHPELPAALRAAGQPVLIGGSMGTGSYVLAGVAGADSPAFASACHGAGRAMSRQRAAKTWQGRAVVDGLAARGILVRSPSSRGVAGEAPGAYKDVAAVVDAAAAAGLARKVARLEPLICIKG